MIYNLQEPLERAQFEARYKHLSEKGARVELTEKRDKRTLSQNSYLHLILSYFAIEYGERLEWVKQEFFKRHVNADIFLLEKEGAGIGRYYALRSSSDLTTKEMTTAIERFIDWSYKEVGIFLPLADDEAMINAVTREVEQSRRYV